jgi:hypothetical protein
MRMAQGDGSFRVTKFALGDDEINYGLYNSAHTGGTPYYDLEIRQIPILESFSNNEASLKSKLISYSNPNLLYLPELIANTNVNKNAGEARAHFQYAPALNSYVVATTAGTVKAFGNTTGVFDGVNPGKKRSMCQLEYGLNVEGQAPGSLRDREPELNETEFIIECDTRFCRIANMAGTPLRANFIDENMIATYEVTLGSRRAIVTQMTQFGSYKDADQPEIKYLRGAMLRFKVLASTLLQTGIPSESKSLWAKHGLAYGSADWDTAQASIGSAETCGAGASDANNLDYRATQGDFYHIDTNIRVTGMNTGARIDLPFVFVKSVNFVTSC